MRGLAWRGPSVCPALKKGDAGSECSCLASAERLWIPVPSVAGAYGMPAGGYLQLLGTAASGVGDLQACGPLTCGIMDSGDKDRGPQAGSILARRQPG